MWLNLSTGKSQSKINQNDPQLSGWWGDAVLCILDGNFGAQSAVHGSSHWNIPVQEYGNMIETITCCFILVFDRVNDEELVQIPVLIKWIRIFRHSLVFCKSRRHQSTAQRQSHISRRTSGAGSAVSILLYMSNMLTSWPTDIICASFLSQWSLERSGERGAVDHHWLRICDDQSQSDSSQKSISRRLRVPNRPHVCLHGGGGSAASPIDCLSGASSHQHLHGLHRGVESVVNESFTNIKI